MLKELEEKRAERVKERNDIERGLHKPIVALSIRQHLEAKQANSVACNFKSQNAQNE